MSSSSPADYTKPRSIEVHLQDGTKLNLQTWFDFDRATHKVECDLCGTIVTLNKLGNPNSLGLHRSSERRVKALRRQETAEEEERKKALLRSMGSQNSTLQPVVSLSGEMITEFQEATTSRRGRRRSKQRNQVLSVAGSVAREHRRRWKQRAARGRRRSDNVRIGSIVILSRLKWW